MFERLLIRYPLFELLPRQKLHSLLICSVTVDFETGEVLFQEGATGAWVHLLLEGRVRILRRAESGRDVSLGMVQAGELFGEYVLLTPHLHTATCRASSDCRVLRIPIGKCREHLHDAGIDGSTLKQMIRLHASMNFVSGRHYLGFMSAPSALTYADCLKPEHFRAMRTLCGPGLAKDRWFLITRGNAVLTDQSGHILELERGDSFGALCLTGLEADETVSTTSDLECLSLRVSDFRLPQPAETGLLPSPNNILRSDSHQTRLTRHLRVSEFPFIAQNDESDCGLAAFAMISQFYNRSEKESIYSEFPILPERGLSLLELRDFARSRSFTAEAYRIDTDHIIDMDCPFIAHFNSGHFTVVYHLDERSALVADPATTLHSISIERLREEWSGHTLVVRIPT